MVEQFVCSFLKTFIYTDILCTHKRRAAKKNIIIIIIIISFRRYYLIHLFIIIEVRTEKTLLFIQYFIVYHPTFLCFRILLKVFELLHVEWLVRYQSSSVIVPIEGTLLLYADQGVQMLERNL